MTDYYVYLSSTLPALHFGARPPFSFENFISYCQRFISEADCGILKKASIAGEHVPETAQPTLKKWQAFDTTLRNELVKARAVKRHLDASKFLRQDKFPELSIIHIAANASRNPSILEAEKMLDEARWGALDEFSFGHYFDLDFLIVYGLKLLILERWGKINTQDKARVLEEALTFD